MDYWSDDDDIERDLDTLSGISSSERRTKKSYTSWGRGQRRVEEPLPELPQGTQGDDDIFKTMFGFSPPFSPESVDKKKKKKPYEWNEAKEYEVKYQIRQVHGANTSGILEEQYAGPSRSNETGSRRMEHKAKAPKKNQNIFSPPRRDFRPSDNFSETAEFVNFSKISNACSVQEGSMKHKVKSPKKNQSIFSSPKRDFRSSNDFSKSAEVNHFSTVDNACSVGEGSMMSPKLSEKLEEPCLPLDSETSLIGAVGSVENVQRTADLRREPVVKPKEKKKQRKYKNAIVDQLVPSSGERHVIDPESWVSIVKEFLVQLVPFLVGLFVAKWLFDVWDILYDMEYEDPL